jgi:gamma-glutamyl-gamma-aminobutyrate hydrolase PuuD
MPETMGLDDAAAHQKDNRHGMRVKVTDSVLLPGKCEGELTVVSYHQQCVSHAGRMRVVAEAPDGVIEAIDDPARPFYLGVQWHPERGGEGPLNRDLLRRFVAACH